MKEGRIIMREGSRIRPGRFQSFVGFIAGCIFCLIGIFYVIPKSNLLFGIVWTLFAILITVTMGMNVFYSRPRKNSMDETEEDEEGADLRNFYTESEVEERLVHLKELYTKELINQKEYEKKKEEILKRL